MTNVWSPTSSNPSAIAALGGDVTGTVGANTVVKLRGRAIAATAPTDGQVYQYVAANSDWEPKTVGGGGGVQVVTVPVTSAQILDLFNTPVTLVAGVAGQAIIPVAVSIAYLPGLVPYLDGGGNLQVNPNNWQSFPTVGIWDQAVGYLIAPGFLTGGTGTQSSVYDGVDLELIETVANPTLGDGTLSVTVAYYLQPV